MSACVWPMILKDDIIQAVKRAVTSMHDYIHTGVFNAFLCHLKSQIGGMTANDWLVARRKEGA